jgi:serine/threonine-protein kinase
MGLLFAALARREQPVPAPEPPETKIDPVEEMQKELLAGHPVTLIGPTGLPKYWRSVFEPITIGPSPLGDQTCYFNAFQFALLELFPDPGLDHYRVDLELRRVWVKESTQGSGTDQVGFYFGYSSESSSGTEACHNMIAVTFKDYPMDGPNPNAPRAVFLQTLGVIQHPDKMPRDESGNFGSKEFLTNPAFGVPGIWRALSVEVSSNGALILWQSDKVVNGKKQMVPVGDGNGKKLAAEYERRKDSLELKSPGAKNLPQWHPRMPLGVLSFKSGISVRNVTITPLP